MKYWKHELKEASGEFYDSLWKSKWFAKEEMTAVVDDEIRLAQQESYSNHRTRFESNVVSALGGEFDSWSDSPHGSMALIILLVSLSLRCGLPFRINLLGTFTEVPPLPILAIAKLLLLAKLAF
jgi:uncharacterized protein (DUF924 family)